MADFKQRLANQIKNTKTTRWVRFAIVSAIFLLWVVLMNNYWLLPIWLILLDLYILNIVPWGWWKKKKGPVRIIMAWVDAIVYALVLIYFVFAFVGQQYEIPSSSLEKSLLVGDRLWVNKTVYGARVPQTPIHFPLAQHTLPILNTKSYIDKPQLEYHRMPGYRKVRRGDIVVFNYPQGDTVALKIQNPDYYQICQELRMQGISDPKAYILSNPERFGKLVWRPVDRRENYVKRAIALPGERLRIVNDTIFINQRAIPFPKNVEFNYLVPVSSPIPTDRWMDLGVRLEDLNGYPMGTEYSAVSYYNVPLTAEMKATVEKWPEVSGKLIRETTSGMYDIANGIFPLGNTYGWNRANLGEIWIPKKGKTLRLTDANYPIYERAIRTYEGNTLERRNGKFYINGKETDRYTFKMDYYWMMGDNRDRSADSRMWGFVPEDHIVGEPLLILASFDQDRSLFNGKIRWNRIFANPNPDGKAMRN